MLLPQNTRARDCADQTGVEVNKCNIGNGHPVPGRIKKELPRLATSDECHDMNVIADQ